MDGIDVLKSTASADPIDMSSMLLPPPPPHPFFSSYMSAATPSSFFFNSNNPAAEHLGGNGNFFCGAIKSKEGQGAGGGMAAMREMIFRIAAMQPIQIDPEAIKAPRRRNVRISKDPQSVAARQRRERISQKIRILQRLVPGGTKMDTASMLDEAVHYVKFLKRQVQTLEEQAAATAAPAPAFHHNHNNNHNHNAYYYNLNSANLNYSSALFKASSHLHPPPILGSLQMH